jgi:pyruvate,water dikinase
MPGIAREALRIRVRWVQELSAGAATELGRRLAAAGAITAPDAVRTVPLSDLVELVRGGAPAPVSSVQSVHSTPLPPVFRLAADGSAVAVDLGGAGGGTPLGGGRGRGVVRTAPADAGPGVVLVVPDLDPRLATVIPALSGLVAETGNPLSHLAILAREYGVPTVVADAATVAALRDGDVVEVDGATGVVRVIEPAGAPQPAPTAEVAP